MKKIIILFLILFLFIGCQNSNIVDREVFKDENGIIYQIKVKLNKPLYEELVFHSTSTGKPYIKNTYYLDDNGNIIKHGPCEGWDENGTKRYSIKYNHGKLTGNSIEWYENGSLKSIQEVRKYGENNEYYVGAYTTFYEDGSKLAHGFYTNDKETYSAWHENGQLACKGIRDNKTNISTCTIWGKRGNRLVEIAVNLNTQIATVRFWTKDGKFFAKGIYKNDKPWSGQIIGGYRKGDKHPGKLSLYENGKILKVISDVPEELTYISFFPDTFSTESAPRSGIRI
jgi:antitoxin component YwqK of YwqJK toxin-antitoxin module